MNQGSANKSLLLLYGAFTALEAFRIIYLRLCFWITDRTGLLDMDNEIFIISCAAILLGMIVFPLALDKTGLGASPARVTTVIRSAAALAGAGAIVSYFTVGQLALTFQFITMLCASGAMSAALRMMSIALPHGIVGRFFGLAQLASALFGAFLFFSPFGEAPTAGMLIAACVLIALAAACFSAHSEPLPIGRPEYADSAKASLSPPKRILSLALIAMCLYAVVGGLLDNLYFFDDAFTSIPFYMFWIFLYAGLLNSFGGYLLDRVSKVPVVVTAFVLICIGQSMAFFTTNPFFGYLYLLFSNGGSCVLELFLLSLPIVYGSQLARNGKSLGILPGLGYILLYGSFFLSSILFLFIPETVYRVILGVALIVAVAALLVVFKLSGEEKALRFLETEKALTDRLAAAQSAIPAELAKERLEAYALTARETEVLRLLIDGKMTSEIAEAMAITERSVQNYINSMLSKTASKTRGGLVAKFLHQAEK